MTTETSSHRTYRHYKGGAYDLIFDGVRDADAPDRELVIYKSRSTGEIWARESAEFHGTVEIDGAVKPRFACDD